MEIIKEEMILVIKDKNCMTMQESRVARWLQANGYQHKILEFEDLFDVPVLTKVVITCAESEYEIGYLAARFEDALICLSGEYPYIVTRLGGKSIDIKILGGELTDRIKLLQNTVATKSIRTAMDAYLLDDKTTPRYNKLKELEGKNQDEVYDLIVSWI